MGLGDPDPGGPIGPAPTGQIRLQTHQAVPEALEAWAAGLRRQDRPVTAGSPSSVPGLSSPLPPPPWGEAAPDVSRHCLMPHGVRKNSGPG